MGKIITFGEIMLRLSSNGYYRLFQNNNLNCTFGGSEANVAAFLANLDMKVEFVSKLPDNELSYAALKMMRGLGIGIDNVILGGNRMGIYFMEKGVSQRSSLCIYDRKGSSFSEAVEGEFYWEDIFNDAEWFHFSGITLALSQNLIDICIEACKFAKSKNIKISCDINYRSKLWSEYEANKVMSNICKYVDVCMINEEDAKNVFGIEAENTNIIKGKINVEGYKEVAKKLVQIFGFEKVAISIRTSITATRNLWQGVIYDGNIYYSKQYDIEIVDRIGAGDCFAGGIIYGLSVGYNANKTIEFAVAASALKHTIEGDFSRVTKMEIDKLLNDDLSGRVIR